jgi:hypothetical protein
MGSALGFLRRNILAGHSEGTQVPGQSISGQHRLTGVIATQVHIQLPVRETTGDPMRPVHRQGGLPYPAVPPIAEITTAPALEGRQAAPTRPRAHAAGP